MPIQVRISNDKRNRIFEYLNIEYFTNLSRLLGSKNYLSISYRLVYIIYVPILYTYFIFPSLLLFQNQGQVITLTADHMVTSMIICN